MESMFSSHRGDPPSLYWPLSLRASWVACAALQCEGTWFNMCGAGGRAGVAQARSAQEEKRAKLSARTPQGGLAARFPPDPEYGTKKQIERSTKKFGRKLKKHGECLQTSGNRNGVTGTAPVTWHSFALYPVLRIPFEGDQVVRKRSDLRPHLPRPQSGAVPGSPLRSHGAVYVPSAARANGPSVAEATLPRGAEPPGARDPTFPHTGS